MFNLPNPPQPITLPIRNAVNHEDRVALLLNKAGSSSDNPLAGSKYTSFSANDASTISTTKGVGLRIKFGIVDDSETISSAKVMLVDSNGDQSVHMDIKDRFVRSGNEWYADLFAGSGEDLPSATESQRIFVTIFTNLDRRIKQQCYVRDVQNNAVLLNGAETSSTAPVAYVKQETAQAQTFPIPTSFFASWNDEIGRQHTGSALSNPVIKPYGGAETVEVYHMVGDTRGSQVVAETPVQDLSSILITGTAGEENEVFPLMFYFRAKAGSDNTIAVRAYVRIYSCEYQEQNPEYAPTMTNVSISGGRYIVSVNDAGGLTSASVIAQRYDPSESGGTLSAAVTTSNVTISDGNNSTVNNSLASGAPSGASVHVVTLSTTAGEDTITFVHTN